jgi:hypothetical protein
VLGFCGSFEPTQGFFGVEMRKAGMLVGAFYPLQYRTIPFDEGAALVVIVVVLGLHLDS